MKGSDKVDEAHIFMDYTSQAGVQSAISRAMGTAPVAHREKLDLTDEEFALVSSDIPPIVPRYQTYVDFGDWMEEVWTEMITS
jgi:putative spermidine/putrescine transport system substrate-binding protein